MTEKYRLPKRDRDDQLISIEVATPMRFVLTGTCGNSFFHNNTIWEFNERRTPLETIDSLEALAEHVNGWANEVRLAHEHTGCMQVPQITIAAGKYNINV